KPNGLIFPDKATIYLAAIEDGDYKEEKIGCKEPLVDTVDSKAIVTSSFANKEIDINTAQKSDLTFSAPFKLTAIRDDYIHAFIA
ncbi:8558_t:CDS:2, partial [Racocetra persica]